MQTRTIELTESEMDMVVKALNILRSHYVKSAKSCEYMGKDYMTVPSQEKQEQHTKNAAKCLDLASKITNEFI